MNFKFLSTVFVGTALLAASATVSGVERIDFSSAKKHPAPSVSRSAVVVPSKKAYAWATRDRGGVEKGIVSFTLDKPGTLTSVHKMPNLAYAGCYAGGKYYFDRYRTVDDSWEHIAFSSVDLATGAITDIKDWSDEYFVINDMTYDYTTGQILAMGRTFYIDDFLPGFQFECSVLMSINPNTGVFREEKLFIDWANGALTNPTYYNIACDLNGTIYSVNQNGCLVTFDRDNDYAEVEIGRTGLKPAKTTQSMEFDHTTGTLYWAADFSDRVAELVVVDTSSGFASTVGETGTDAHLIGLCIPFDEPSPAAPGSVTEFKAVPDATGARTISLEWKNPVKSYGGANLISISSVKILRNDVEIASLTGTPGETMHYEDNVSDDALYSYTVVAANSAGNGLPSGLSRWVGKDVPMAVSNLGVGRNSDGSAILEWVAPVSGLHGGVIDTGSLGYKITRFPDGTILASDFRGTSFTDNTVPGTGRYSYTVESHTDQGVGEVARSVEIALGAAIDRFPWNTMFADRSEFDLWTVVDMSGGSTWQWKARTAGGYETQAMYQYDSNFDGDDYLISPDLYLEKDARYKVKFAYAGANAYHTEKMELTFGKGKTAEAQSTVLKEFTMNDGEFRFFETELPAVSETGYYNFAFHAISPAGQFNIYVTDVTVTQTVVGPGGDYDFAVPANLQAVVDDASGSVTLTWNESSGGSGVTENIFEDFESISKWEINPAGNFGWTYIDGDGGIPYVDDYYEMPYPTDGKPLAAMVMAPYELHEYVYSVNPPYSGDQYLLFKSNFCAADRSKPAPAPDDWFISPELNFSRDFIFRFWCKADPDAEGYGDPWNTEQFYVGYSLTDNKPESFKWMTDTPEKVTTLADEWTKKEYSIPAAAKYVCIRYCTSECGYWFMVDDVFIGVEAAPSAVAMRAGAIPTFRAYDVYVDDVKVASTQETSHTVSGLATGQHVAKVVAVYAEGSSEPAVVPFILKSSGIDNCYDNGVRVYPNPASERVFFGVEASRACLYDLSGVAVAETAGSESMELGGVAPGLYILKIEYGGQCKSVRLVVR